MRHDNLTAELARCTWINEDSVPRQPCLCLHYDGELTHFKETFRNSDGTGYTPDQLDIFYRPQLSAGTDGLEGMLSVTDRLCGEYLLEVPTSPDLVEDLVHAVRSYGDTTDSPNRYQIQLWSESTKLATFEHDTFLVYDRDGWLLKGRSLIPERVNI